MSSSSRRIVATAAMAAISLVAISSVRAQQVGDVFYIAMENHNWTQPSSLNGSINQIYGDTVAAPYINSLVTAGNVNASNVSYATSYYNAGINEHPSEPNYIWAEAGTNFNPTSVGTGNYTAKATSTNMGTINGTTISSSAVSPSSADADPTLANGNVFASTFASNHLTGQLNAAGIPWKNYQEDVQYSTAPTVSISGTGGVSNGMTVTANPYNGASQYNYAAKHNPMAFFADTANTPNTVTMGQLSADLTNNTVGRYNWITPNQYNDMHSALAGSYNFTYNGVTYNSTNNAASSAGLTLANDQEMIAQGDHYLSIVIPQIEASQAFKHNGTIVIWNDETEGTDTTGATSMEIVISPLAKGNGYAVNDVLSHSSDVKTMEELFGLSQINNPIPSTETFAGSTGFATVQSANDLSNFFVAGAVPEPTSLSLVSIAAMGMLRRRRKA